MYKAVFLDIGGVILKIDWRKPFEYAGIFDPRRQQELIQHFHGSSIFHRFERGEILAPEFLSGFNDLMGVHHPAEFWAEAWQILILNELPGVDALFDELEGHYPVYALSNTNTLHYDYMMKQFPVLQRFDKIIASCAIGERKPDAAFFLKACEICGVKPEEALFVDDTFENIEGARRVGIRSHQTVNSVHETREFLRSLLRLPGAAKV